MAKWGRPRESGSEDVSAHASEHVSGHASEIDRLIQLASEEKPERQSAERAAQLVTVPDPKIDSKVEPKNREENAMWNALLQLKVLLPYLSRLLPLLGVELGHAQNSSFTNELREDVNGMRTAQRDLQGSIQEQTLQLKRVEEQLVRVREASEKNAREHAELVEDVKSIGNLVRVVAAGLGILLVVLIVMVGILMAHMLHP